MPHASRTHAIATAPHWRVVALALAFATIAPSASAHAQAHDHAGHAMPARDALRELLLSGPHVVLYHRGYLRLDDTQIAQLQRLQRTVCAAEQGYVERSEQHRTRLAVLLDETAELAAASVTDTAPPQALQEALLASARAESQWLTTLLHARRDALALLTPTQRENAVALRDHWAREAEAMIEESTRPGQRGHPGTQIPIRVPGMVVGATTLLPYCEVLHGPASHIVIPPPR
jgi:hypothetical protein